MIFRLFLGLQLIVNLSVLAQPNCEQTSVLSNQVEKNAQFFNQAVIADLYSCLGHLSSDDLVTERYREDFWEIIDNKKKFMFRCSEGDGKEEIRYLMIGQQGIESLNYPVYSYQVKFRDGTTQKASLPRNFLRFFHNKIEYIMIETFDSVKMVPRSQLAASAKEEMTSVTRIESEYFKKYEDFLIKEKGKSHITPTDLEAEKMGTLTPCFERILQTYIRQIVEKEARKLIPFNGQFNPDLKKIYSSSPEELRNNKVLTERYKLKPEEIKKTIIDYFINRLKGSCSTQIDANILSGVLEDFYQKDLEDYGTVHRVISRRIN